jgi:glycosyltransferase involved in cell wall biosynthesis
MSASPPFPVTTRTIFESRPRELPGTGVTVIVSSYNYGRYALDALASVHAQTHRNLELIALDNCSTDQSVAIIASWMEANGARFSRARFLSHDQNYGVVQSRNTCFQHASNEFVFVLDIDNILFPTAIAKLLNGCMHAGAHAAFSQLELFDQASDIAGAGIWDPDRLERGNYIDAIALIRKSTWQAVGGYGWLIKPEFADYDLWCKFIEHGFKGAFIPEVLCRYRIHGDSMLRRMSDHEREQLYCELLLHHPWMKL